MSEFHDPELRQELGRLSGPYPDDNVAFAAWQRRVGQARRRRAVAWTSGAAMTLVVATIGFAALQSPGRHTVVPGKSAETSVSVTPSIATTEADDSTTVDSTLPETSAPTSALDTTVGSEVEVESSLPDSGGDPAAGSLGGGTKNHGSSTPAAPSSGTAATQTFTSPGGSITVHFDGEKLSIVSISPAAGFDKHESDDGDNKVGVVFTNGTRRIQLTVRLTNGVMKSSVTEGVDSHGDSVPHDTTADQTEGDHG